MFPKTCNLLPNDSDMQFAVAIGAALRSELGDGHRAAKTVMRWTGACERTARIWLSGKGGPSGCRLIMLMRESDAVATAVLKLAEREQMQFGLALSKIRTAHLEAVRSIDAVLGSSG